MKSYLTLIFSLLIYISLSAQQASWYAGTANTSGSNPTGVTLANAKFNEPYGIAKDTNGNIYVSNNGGHTIMILTGGNAYTRAGNYGNNGFYDASGIASKFSNPRGMAVGPDNALYIADYGNHVIRRLSPFTTLGNTQSVSVFAGRFTTGATNYTSHPGYNDGIATNAQFRNPAGICIDDAGNIYVADMGNHVIRKITSSGTVSTLAGSAGNTGITDGKALVDARFNSPSDVFLLGNKLYISDLGNSRIRVLDLTKDSVFTVTSASSLWTPTNIIALNNDLYFSDQHRILKHSTYTEVYSGSTSINISGYINDKGNSSRYNQTRQLFFHTSDNAFYIAEMDNHVIRKLTLCPDLSSTLSVSGNTTFCQGDSVILTGPAGFPYYKWSSGESTRSITVKNNGTYSLSYKNADSCSGMSNAVTVTVNSVPTSTFNVKKTACLNISDTISYTGNAGTGASFTWNFNQANVSSGSGKGPYILSWSSTGSKVVSLTVTENACTSATKTDTVHVYSIPTASFIVKNKLCVNERDTITFGGTAGSNATYVWNFDGATIVSGSGSGPYIVNWTSAGKKNLSLYVRENGCVSNTYALSIDIYASPISNFTLTSSICGRDTATATFTGTAGTSAIYNWDFDGATVVSGSGAGPYQLTWNNAGSKQLSLIIEENGCYSQNTNKGIQVKQIPTSTFKLDRNICTVQPDTVTYTGNASSSATFTWDWGTAQIYSGSGAGPYIVYWTSSGQKYISLQVNENGCESSITKDTINVGTAVTSDFTIISSTCENQSVIVTYTGNGNSSANYNWDFNGADIISGSNLGPYTIKWNSHGNKVVSLIVINAGCSSGKTTKNINVGIQPTSTFTASSTLCTGQFDTIRYTGNALTTAVYTWNFDGGTVLSGSGQGPYVVYWTSPGQKNITLQVTQGSCSSGTQPHSLTINAGAVADFSISNSLCLDEIITVTFTGSAGTSAIFTWDFDGAVIVSGSGKGPYQIKWTSSGNKSVKLTVSENACTTSPFSRNVTVNPLPASSFTSNNKVCKDALLDISYSGDAIPVANFAWNFDGAHIQSGSGIGPYKIRWNTTGTKSISLEVTQFGCKSTKSTLEIEVLPLPQKPIITQSKDSLISSADERNQWYNQSGGKINDADQKVYKPTQSGMFYVIVTDTNGCTAQSETYNYIKVSINDKQASAMQLYPIPTTGTLTISSNGDFIGGMNITLWSADGRMLKEIHSEMDIVRMDISDLADGLYFVQILMNDKIYHKKIIKSSH